MSIDLFCVQLPVITWKQSLRLLQVIPWDRIWTMKMTTCQIWYRQTLVDVAHQTSVDEIRRHPRLTHRSVDYILR